MMKNYQTAIVTGASHGIGPYIVRALAKGGMNLHVSAMDKAFLSPPEAVARAVLKSIRRDKAEIVFMPGPGRLLRALMDLFPGVGSMMGQMEAPVMKQVVDFRERQREQMDASHHHLEEQR